MADVVGSSLGVILGGAKLFRVCDLGLMQCTDTASTGSLWEFAPLRERRQTPETIELVAVCLD